MKIKLSDIKEKAKTRPEGYYEAVMAIGYVADNVLVITDKQGYYNLLKKFNPSAAQPARGCCGTPHPSLKPTPQPVLLPTSSLTQVRAGAAARGLGDLVAKVAQPIAKAIDKVAGTNLKECGGCKKRQAALNKMFPFQSGSAA